MSEAPDRIDVRNLPPVPVAERPEIREDWVPSQTFLRHHDRCDRAAMLYLTHRGGTSSHQLNRGTIAHAVFDRLLRWCAEHGEPQATPEQGREVLAEVMREYPELQVPAEERDALRYMVDHFCRGTYFPNTIIGIETTLTLEINGFRVLIRCDLIEDLGGGVCQITDWKTAWPPSSEEFTRQAYSVDGEPRWAGNYQLNMGAVVARFGVAADGLPLGDFNRYRLVLGFPRELRPEGIVQRSIEVTELQLDAYREDLEIQLDRLRDVNFAEGRWQPTPGSHCTECPAEYYCPLPRLLRPDSQHASLETKEELEDAARAANFGAKRNEALKRRIKKAALRLEEIDGSALALPGGDRGVMCGKDEAFVFVPTVKNTIPDKARFRLAVEDAMNGGPEPEWSKLERTEEGTSFLKRKVASE